MLYNSDQHLFISLIYFYTAVPGFQANAADIAPKYAGIVFGISNTLASIPGFLSPQVAGIFLKDGVSSTRPLSLFDPNIFKHTVLSQLKLKITFHASSYAFTFFLFNRKTIYW